MSWKMSPCKEVWKRPVLVHHSIIRWWQINESVGCPFVEDRLTMTLKLCCFMSLLISQGKCKPRARVSSHSEHCILRLSDKSCWPTPQNEGAQRASEPLFIRHCQQSTCSACCYALVVVWTWTITLRRYPCDEHETLRPAAKWWWCMRVTLQLITSCATGGSTDALSYLRPAICLRIKVWAAPLNR